MIKQLTNLEYLDLNLSHNNFEYRPENLSYLIDCLKNL